MSERSGDQEAKWLQVIAKAPLLSLYGFCGGSLKISLRKGRLSNKPVLVTKPRWNDKSGHIRQIAPPIYGKIFEHEHWRKLWTAAFNAMCDAEVIAVVGCSLIDTDFHLRALLSQVARTRKQRDDKFQYAAFVDNVKIRRKWEAILKGSFKSTWGYNTFEKFLDEGLGV